MCDVLVSCEWLKSQLDAGLPEKTVIVDVSWSSKKDCYEDFGKEHIPGAQFLNVMDGDHSNILFPRNIPERESFQQNVRNIGINNDTHVIVYSNTDHCGFFMSGRAWWTFHIFGHQNVSVLNGGLEKWKDLKYNISAEVSKPQPGSFVATWTEKYYCKIEEVLKNIPAQSFQVLDSRNEASHSEHGYIPGATNIPLASLMDQENKQMKPLADIKRILVEAGIDPCKPITSHCNSGMSSCSLALAAKMCGSDDVSVYHGGFTEFKNKAAEKVLKKE